MNLPTEATTIIMATDSTLANVGRITATGGTLSAIGGWIVSSTGAAVIGILGVVIGVLIQWYFKSRDDKRRQEEHLWKRELHLARLAQIKAGDLKASPSELIDAMKNTPAVPEVPVEHSAVKVLNALEIVKR